MITPQEALERLQQVAQPLPPGRRALSSALGLVLAKPVSAREPFPRYNVAAMDGYAVRIAAAGKALPVGFTVKAGDWPPPLPEGSCARIFTGAVVPEGAEAVVPQEDISSEGQWVSFPANIKAGANIRFEGEICQRKEELLQSGLVLGPTQIALLIAAGVETVVTFRLAKVALLTTGSELKNRRPAPGQIIDSNSPMLAGLLAREPATLTWKKHTEDDWERLRQALRQALEKADLVITSGGVSVGDFDLLPQVVAELRGQVLFHKVAMQPGKPVLVATFGEKGLLALPGNPVSALVGFHLFARPWLRTLAGYPQAFIAPWPEYPLSRLAANQGKRHQFLPALVTGRGAHQVLEVLPWKGSHDLRAAAQATHLVHLPPGFRGEPGTPVRALRIT